MSQNKCALLAVGIAAMLVALQSGCGAADFPFDREMLLDVAALPGSKRVPILEIGTDGRAQIDLWCRSGAAQVAVADDTIKFTLGPLREEGCTPERRERDEAMVAALSEVTRWRIEDDIVVFSGPTELRFHLSTH